MQVFLFLPKLHFFVIVTSADNFFAHERAMQKPAPKLQIHISTNFYRLEQVLQGLFPYTVACIIVHRLLILVHKWQTSGMADTHEYWSQHDAHLVYLPIFHGLNLIIFS